jgi:hypothetical protein
MKKKHTLILLFMFLFAGVTFLGYTPAQAEYLKCSDAEIGSKYCFQITAPLIEDPNVEIPIWVMRAVDAEGDTYSGPEPFTWPYTDASGNAVFGYQIGAPDTAIQAVKDKLIAKPSGGSYIYFVVANLPLFSNPGGAALDIQNIPYYCDQPELGLLYAYKVNARWNFGKVASLELFYPKGTGVDIDCVNCGVIWSNECRVVNIAGPAGGGVAEPLRKFECTETGQTVEVTYKRCTGEIETVECDGNAPVDVTYDNYFYAHIDDPDDPTRTTKTMAIQNMGPPTGVVACTSGGAVLLVGGEAHWCNGKP